MVKPASMLGAAPVLGDHQPEPSAPLLVDSPAGLTTVFEPLIPSLATLCNDQLDTEP